MSLSRPSVFALSGSFFLRSSFFPVPSLQACPRRFVQRSAKLPVRLGSGEVIPAMDVVLMEINYIPNGGDELPHRTSQQRLGPRRRVIERSVFILRERAAASPSERSRLCCRCEARDVDATKPDESILELAVTTGT